MAQKNTNIIADVLARQEPHVLESWIKEQLEAPTHRSDLIKQAQLRSESTEFLRLMKQAVQSGNLTNIQGSEWKDTREMLSSLSRSRARQGFSPTETATFIFSLKQPIIAYLREAMSGASTEALLDEVWQITTLLDSLGLYTAEIYQQSRDEIIARQQAEMLELSTPVVKLWEGILALPLIGTLDSARTQVVMESLLQAIVDTSSSIAIIDITGVPTVDTLVSQHLLKTVAAARLMGAECIISGIRPQIAQTIVHLGVDLSQVATKASLSDAFILALQKTGRGIGINGRGTNGGPVGAPGAPRV